MTSHAPLSGLHPGPLTVRTLQAMHGANYYSSGPVIVMALDLGDYAETPTSQISGFFEGLAERVPSLEQHHCSPGHVGGFFERVREGTLLGHVTEHVAIELQTLAGMDVAYGKTRESGTPGVFHVVFRFFDELAGITAGIAAVNLVNVILTGGAVDVSAIVDELVDIRERRLPGPSTQAILDEAAKRGIPTRRLDDYNLVRLGTGRHRRLIRATLTSMTGLIAAETAADKLLSLRMLADAGVPVPETRRVDSVEEALLVLAELGGPLVLKPVEGRAGQGVTPGIETPDRMIAAFARIGEPPGILQRQVAGASYRLLVIDRRLVAAVKTVPPIVAGDGQRSIAQLVAALNEAPERGVGDKARLSAVELDETALEWLAATGYTPESVPSAGETVPLRVSGSLRLGGSATDVTDSVHPGIRFHVERAATILGLDVAGVDIVAPGLGRPLSETGGAVIEVNAAPDFRPHLRPTVGSPRPVAGPLLDMLFPAGTPVRVPLFSVTGTAGKTVAVHLLDHVLRRLGRTVGMTCTEGLFIDGRPILEGDATYPEQVGILLGDPAIDTAVLETSREGILRRGLGYERADFGIVLNLHEDHVGGVGGDQIRRLDDLAYAKSVVAEQVFDDGFAVLNADNELVFSMRERAYCPILPFSRSARHPEILKHVEKGGLAVFLEDGAVILQKGRTRIGALPLAGLPLTRGGALRCHDESLLAVVGALYAHGVPFDDIVAGLSSFPADGVPGRTNLIHARGGEFLLDYAHNEPAYRYLGEFLHTVPGTKAGLLDAPGDRPDDDIRRLGELAAGMFGLVILYEDENLRGRKPGEVTALLTEGALKGGLTESGIIRVADLEEGLQALEMVKDAGLRVILTERWKKAVSWLHNPVAGTD